MAINKQEMMEPKMVGLDAAVCIVNPAAAIAVFGTATGQAIAAAGIVCNLPAVVPLVVGGSLIS